MTFDAFSSTTTDGRSNDQVYGKTCSAINCNVTILEKTMSVSVAMDERRTKLHHPTTRSDAIGNCDPIYGRLLGTRASGLPARCRRRLSRHPSSAATDVRPNLSCASERICTSLCPPHAPLYTSSTCLGKLPHLSYDDHRCPQSS